VRQLASDIRWRLVNLFTMLRINTDSDLDALIEMLTRWKNGERGEIAAEFGQDFANTSALMGVKSEQDLEDHIEILKSLARTGSWRLYQ